MASFLEPCARRDYIVSVWDEFFGEAYVRFDEDSFWIELSDGRRLGVSLAWFPRLLALRPSSAKR